MKTINVLTRDGWRAVTVLAESRGLALVDRASMWNDRWKREGLRRYSVTHKRSGMIVSSKQTGAVAVTSSLRRARRLLRELAPVAYWTASQAALDRINSPAFSDRIAWAIKRGLA